MTFRRAQCNSITCRLRSAVVTVLLKFICVRSLSTHSIAFVARRELKFRELQIEMQFQCAHALQIFQFCAVADIIMVVSVEKIEIDRSRNKFVKLFKLFWSMCSSVQLLIVEEKLNCSRSLAVNSVWNVYKCVKVYMQRAGVAKLGWLDQWAFKRPDIITNLGVDS